MMTVTVSKDTRTYVKAKGYYITARPSSEDPSRIICHLKKRAYGPVGNFLRALFPSKGQNYLTKWSRPSSLTQRRCCMTEGRKSTKGHWDTNHIPGLPIFDAVVGSSIDGWQSLSRRGNGWRNT